MKVYVCHTEPAHPKCPYARRFVHEIIDVLVEWDGGVVGTNEFGHYVSFPSSQLIRTYIGYQVARQRALQEFYDAYKA